MLPPPGKSTAGQPSAPLRPRPGRGVAILTVLAVLSLMAVLAVSILKMSSGARMSSLEKLEAEEPGAMRDTVISLLTAQLSTANNLITTGTGTPGENLSWTTQPGAIRTYSAGDPVNNKVFKLYSSAQPVLSGVLPGASGAMLDSLGEDLADDWAARPDEYTDLNLAASRNGELLYPIADPRMYNGNPEDMETNTEGFSYSARHHSGKTMGGVDPALGQLAMPVRWIYQLKDGTLGYLSRERVFIPADSAQTAALSPENPIVGRMAWWADDETCKVNLNTASVPAIWDTPRTTSLEDVWLARTQPLAGEFQRYPGHPATVDLSAVFFPGRRWTGTDGTWTMSAGASMKGSLSADQANLIWGLTPFISNSLTPGQPGTLGGTSPTPLQGASVSWKTSHLYASVDEAALAASGRNPDNPDDPLQNANLPGGRADAAFLQRLERSRFFLTHRSSSPEMTNHGYPRVAMFPVDTRTTPYVQTSTPVPADGSVSPYEISIATMAMLGKKPYYLQRSEPVSRHADLWNVSGSANPGRNINLIKYLKELSRLPIPGYPSSFNGATAFPLEPALAEDVAGLSFAAKYPAGFNKTTGKRYTDSGLNQMNGNTLFDASDRTQILLSLLDYTRSLNMQPAFMPVATRYDAGFGQATAFCGCGGKSNDADHAKALSSSIITWRVPRGAGKLLAPAEIAMVVNVAARKNAGGAAPSNPKDWAALVSSLEGLSQTIANDETADRAIVEIGFVMSGFNPKMGWAPVTGQGGIMITAVTEPSGLSNISGAVLPFKVTLDGSGEQDLKVGKGSVNNTGGVNSTGRKMAGSLIPYGGMQGPRSAIAAAQPNGEGNSATAPNFATLNPICVRLKTGSGDIDLPVTDNSNGNAAIRILILDGSAYESNVTSSVDLRFPPGWWGGLKVPLSVAGGGSLRTKAMNYTAPGPTLAFPESASVVRSLSIPHGDYRLATSIHTDSDLFVANSNWNSRMGHSFYEANEKADQRQKNYAVYNSLTLINREPGVGVNAPGVTEYIAPSASPAVTGNQVPMSSLPLPGIDESDRQRKRNLNPPDAKAEELASGFGTPARKNVFSFGRLDGHALSPLRGSSDPDETGDFDNGPGAAEDGPYMNHADEGDRRTNANNIPYFTGLTNQLKSADPKAAQCISPNFLVRSPVDFGSIPSGLQNRVPWQTLRFRPDPGMNDPAKRMSGATDSPPAGLPFANFCGPRDHFFLDMFWMPVVEPWAISAMTSTQGTINLNQQILPFVYIQRTTALHALLRGERMLAIPNAAAAKYKKVVANGTPDNTDPGYRHFINAGETVKQFTRRWEEGKDPEGFPLAFNTFRSASEICEVWLVPDKNGGAYEDARPWDLSWIIGRCDSSVREGFWVDHRLTGDNSRERPYANLYPRVTVRSNVFKLHLITQTLSSPPTSAGAAVGSLEVKGQWRGSCLLERSMNPTDPRLSSLDHTNLNAAAPNPAITPRLENFQSFSTSNLQEFAPTP